MEAMHAFCCEPLHIATTMQCVLPPSVGLVEIVDHRLIGALHVDLVDRAHLAEDPDGAAAFQTSSLEALLDGAYEGDLTVGELLQHGDLGLGTVDHLDGELVVVDGEAFVVRGDGTVEQVPPGTGTPFAAVCHFRPGPPTALAPAAALAELTGAIDVLAGTEAVLLAVRVEVQVAHAVVRSVHRQQRPYPPLREVTAHQHEWQLHDLAATVVGFRFPHVTAGLEVPGWHLHLLSADRTAGGHLVELAITGGRAEVAVTDQLHVEVPASVTGAGDGKDRRDEVAAVEGGT
jgi:acetolactate decarboxylase